MKVLFALALASAPAPFDEEAATMDLLREMGATADEVADMGRSPRSSLLAGPVLKNSLGDQVGAQLKAMGASDSDLAAMDRMPALSKAQMEDMRKAINPRSKLPDILSKFDQACTNDKCGDEKSYCRKADPKCNKHFQCLEDDGLPQTCFENVQLDQMSMPFTRLFTCLTSSNCVEVGGAAMADIEKDFVPPSLMEVSANGEAVHLPQGQDTLKEVEAGLAKFDAGIKADIARHKERVANAHRSVDSSYAELDAKVARLSAPFDDSELDALKTGSAMADFSSMQSDLAKTKDAMDASQQKLASLSLKLAHDEQTVTDNIKKHSKGSSLAEVGRVVSPEDASTITSVIKDELASFVSKAGKSARADEVEMAGLSTDFATKLQDSMRKFKMETEVLSHQPDPADKYRPDPSVYAHTEQEPGSLLEEDAWLNKGKSAAMMLSEARKMKEAAEKATMDMIDATQKRQRDLFPNGDLKPADKFTAMLEGFLEESKSTVTPPELLKGLDSFFSDKGTSDALFSGKDIPLPKGLTTNTLTFSLAAMTALGVGKDPNATAPLHAEMEKMGKVLDGTPLSLNKNGTLMTTISAYMKSGDEADLDKLEGIFPHDSESMYKMLGVDPTKKDFKVELKQKLGITPELEKMMMGMMHKGEENLREHQH